MARSPEPGHLLSFPRPLPPPTLSLKNPQSPSRRSASTEFTEESSCCSRQSSKMANDTRSSWENTVHESNSSRKKPGNRKESFTPGYATMDASRLRRSTGEMPLQKQMSPRPSTSSNSEHLDRQTPTTTPFKRKSDIVEKQKMPSSSRRSDWGEECQSLGCSNSMNSEKRSGSSDDRRKKLKTEESVEQLMQEARETSRRVNKHPHTVGLKKKMNGRTYKWLIKQKRKKDTEPGSVSKPVDDGEDGVENGASHVDAAAPPSSKCEMDNMAGTNVQCSEKTRGQRFGSNPEIKTHEVGNECKVNSPASPRPRRKEGPGDEAGDSGVPANNVPRLLPPSTDSLMHKLHSSHASASTFPSMVTSFLSEVHVVKSEEGTGLCDVRKTLHVLLKPGISKLCEILQLSEDIKDMVRRFLDYVVDNHQVNREPVTIIQAFQISLCWIAASLRKYEIDKKASLALAKQHLNFGCTEEEAKNVHSKLRLLKKRFKVAVHDLASDRLTSKQQRAPRLKIEEKELLKSIKRIQKKCAKRMMKLNLKQQEEIQELNKTWKDDSAQLENDYRLELALIRSIHCNDPVRSEKMKRLEEEYANKRRELEDHKVILLRKLEAEHLAEMDGERRKEESCLQDVKSWAQAELSFELPSYASEFGGSCNHRVHDGPEHVAFPFGGLVEEVCPNRMQTSELEPSERPRTFGSETLGCGVPIDSLIIQLHPNSGTDSVDANLDCSSGAHEYHGFVDPDFEKQIPDGSPSSEQGTPESVPYGVVGAAEFVEILNADVESDRELDQIEDLDVSVLDLMDVQNDAAGSPINGGSLKKSFLAQPVNALAQAGSLPQISVLLGECSKSSNSTGMHNGDAQSSENQDNLLQVKVVSLHCMDNGPTDQTNDEDALTARVEQLQPSKFVGMDDKHAESSENQDVSHQVDILAFHFMDNGPTDQTKDEEPMEQLQSSKSTGMHDGDAEASANQDGLQQVEVVPLHSTDNEPTDQMNDEEVWTELVEQLPSCKSAGMHDGDAVASENQDSRQQFEVVPFHSTDKGPTDWTKDDEALTELVEQLQSSKSTGMHDGDAKGSENQYPPHYIEVVPLDSTDNGPTDLINDQEALTEYMEQLQSSKANGMHDGDAEASENHDGPQQVEVVLLPSTDNGPADQTNDEEALTECVEQPQLSKSTGLHDGDAEASENQDVLNQVEVVPLHSTDNGPADQTNDEETLSECVEQLQLSESSGMDDGDAQAGRNQDGPQQVKVIPCHSTYTTPTVQPDVLVTMQMSPSSVPSVDHHRPDVLASSGVEQLPSEGLGASQPFDNEPEALAQVVRQPGEDRELPPPVHAKDAPLGSNLQLAVENDNQPSSQGFLSFQDADDSSQLEDTAWIPNQAVPHTLLGMHPPLGGYGAHLLLNSTPQMAPQMLSRPLQVDPLLKELERVQKEKEQTIKTHEETKLVLKFDCDKEIEVAIAEIRRKYGDKFQNAESAFLLKRMELDSNAKKVLMNKILADAFQSNCHALLRTQQGVPCNIMQQHLPSSRPASGPACVNSSASVPFVHHSSPHFSTIPAGPPLIAPVTPPTRNFRVGGEIRAPAPHLQRFRPSSSMPSTSIPSMVPRGMLPIQHAQRNLPPAFPSVPHNPTISPSVSQADATGRVMAMLFNDVDNQLGALPNRPLMGSNFGSLDLSQLGAHANGGGSGVVNIAGSGVVTDVVCLSDDD